ncbi:hypothetical protein KKY_1726 [Pelagibacterium halotolerans B2]|uniref:Transmembrane protein n=2 Tax=Pelagibacterium TaxID=1082930 RepID=G4RCT6_PELHB|nr:hypothetical protein [Pelagibacterium halotolerans]AEQ51741.1 hypothetical protein KKY_1726 [Pelagibacterium halotolerans B2]
METTPVPPRHMLVLIMGFGLWSAAFVALYAVNAIGCAFAWPTVVQRWVMIGLAVICSAALLGVAGWSIVHWRRAAHAARPVPSLARIGTFTSVAALAATIFVSAPSFFVSMCM